MSEWNDALAGSGYLVVNAGWLPGGAEAMEPTVSGALSTPGAVRCAVDHARAEADALGVEPDVVAVVGVSAGAYFAVLTALGWDDVARTGCDAAAGPPPDVVVGLAGAYDAARRGPLASNLADRPEVLAQLDPFERAGARQVGRIVLVHGAADPVIPIEVARDLVDSGRGDGINVELHVIDDGRHFEFGSPASDEGRAAMAVIGEALG